MNIYMRVIVGVIVVFKKEKSFFLFLKTTITPTITRVKVAIFVIDSGPSIVILR